MKSFRHPLLHWSAGLLLVAGLFAHILAPASGSVQKSTFVQWLDHHLVMDGGETKHELRNHLRQLSAQTEEFPHFLKQATQLVLDNRNDFRLSPGTSSDRKSESVFWLLETWNLQRDLPGKMSSLTVEPVKQLIKWLTQTHPFQGLKSASLKRSVEQLSAPLPVVQPTLERFLSPFLSGVSINAP